MGSACFTGHRVIPQTEEIKERLYSVLERWICTKGITDFYAGGAVGWDTLAAATVLKLREVYPQVKLHLVLPCASEQQTAKWTSAQQSEFFRIRELADSVEYICENYFKGCKHCCLHHAEGFGSFFSQDVGDCHNDTSFGTKYPCCLLINE